MNSLQIGKNPSSWRNKYSLVLFWQGHKFICSQHKTKITAIRAKSRLIRKYKTAQAIHDKYLGWS